MSCVAKVIALMPVTIPKLHSPRRNHAGE